MTIDTSHQSQQLVTIHASRVLGTFANVSMVGSHCAGFQSPNTLSTHTTLGGSTAQLTVSEAYTVHY